jgi:hypothetical protein
MRNARAGRRCRRACTYAFCWWATRANVGRTKKLRLLTSFIMENEFEEGWSRGADLFFHRIRATRELTLGVGVVSFQSRELSATGVRTCDDTCGRRTISVPSQRAPQLSSRRRRPSNSSALCRGAPSFLPTRLASPPDHNWPRFSHRTNRFGSRELTASWTLVQAVGDFADFPKARPASRIDLR